ncbi:MAG: efflux RND transporter periplasmic adaptor subunit [Acidobacteria bacterium]|nr:MAG: efflux RND transporter periplasmic adaptor subunit [Acidobacteriota bacterium]
MKRINFSYFALVLVIIGLVVGLAGCSQKQELDPRTNPERVRIVEIGSPSGADPAFTGVVSARVQSSLGFRVPGKITKRLVDTGQFVRAGQPLMTIDRTDYVHAITARSETVAAAKAKALQAASDEARYRGLVKSGAVSASIYDQIKAASDAAQAELAAATAQEQVARDEGGYSQILADADGIVIETLAEPGQVVMAGQTVVKLAHSGPREAAVNLPETLRPAVGSAAYATLYGNAMRVPVRLRQLAGAADPQTRTFEARYVLEGTAANAPLGATVTVHLSGDGGADDMLQVPVASVLDRGKGPGIWLLNPSTSTVSFQPVQVRQLGEELASISGNLHPGQQVVALGVHLLRDGQRVRVESKAEIQ